jgi:hypothetical protein
MPALLRGKRSANSKGCYSVTPQLLATKPPRIRSNHSAPMPTLVPEKHESVENMQHGV